MLIRLPIALLGIALLVLLHVHLLLHLLLPCGGGALGFQFGLGLLDHLLGAQIGVDGLNRDDHVGRRHVIQHKLGLIFLGAVFFFFAAHAYDPSKARNLRAQSRAMRAFGRAGRVEATTPGGRPRSRLQARDARQGRFRPRRQTATQSFLQRNPFRRGGARLLRPKRLQPTAQPRIVQGQALGREQSGVRGARFADGERRHGDALGHLHNRKQ